MKLYRRENFLQKIRGFYHDTELIEVITGVRRCGKSCLMETVVFSRGGESLEFTVGGVQCWCLRFRR